MSVGRRRRLAWVFCMMTSLLFLCLAPHGTAFIFPHHRHHGALLSTTAESSSTTTALSAIFQREKSKSKKKGIVNGNDDDQDDGVNGHTDTPSSIAANDDEEGEASRIVVKNSKTIQHNNKVNGRRQRRQGQVRKTGKVDPKKKNEKKNTANSTAKAKVVDESLTTPQEEKGEEKLEPTDLLSLMEEVNSRVVSGTAEMLSNLTLGMEEQLEKSLPDTSAQELSSMLTEFSAEIQRAQQTELERQIAALERKLVRPLEDLAFSDVPLLEVLEAKKKKRPATAEASGNRSATTDETVPHPEQLILMGKNSTLQLSRRMRTSEILRNFNVAPFYYSIALTLRWFRKASYPSIYLLSLYTNIANVVKSNTKAKKRFDTETAAGGEGLQAGWKRTGEIAAKGSLSKKWAIFRRSAEIWAYFSSFYLKDRRINAKYNSGQWSEEKFKEERSKLGKEITDNLLKLGPTFISKFDWYP